LLLRRILEFKCVGRDLISRPQARGYLLQIARKHARAVNFLTAMGLFIGQSPAFFELLGELAGEADAAQRA